MKRLLTRIALVLLIILGASGVGVWWYLRPRQQVFLTDGGSINESSAVSRIREILWEPPVKLAQQINIPVDVYEPCLSTDGLTLFFVRGRTSKNADIFVCTKTPQGWTDAVPLTAINTPHDELGPHISPNGRELYFYSDRPGTLGGYDLWVSRKEGDSWQNPVNLGPSINSAANEYGPALSPDGKWLMFASNRPKAGEQTPTPSDAWTATIREDLTRRDYDLYIVSISSPNAKCQPVDRINSAANEGAAAFSPFGDFLYFSSDRPGGSGGFDLYRSRWLRGEFLEAENLGSQVNTAANELDPALGLGGYGLHFSSDRPDEKLQKREYQLYYTASREVFRDIHFDRAIIDWAGLWRAIAPNLLWAILALILTLLLIALLRDMKNRRLSLLAKCLLASLLLHTMLMLLFNVWQVGTTVAQAIRKGPIRVGLGAGSGGRGGLAGQIRGNLTNVDISIPGSPSIQQGEHKVSLVPLRSLTRLPTAPTKVDITPSPMKSIPIADAAPAHLIVQSPKLQSISPAVQFDISVPQEASQQSSEETTRAPGIAMQAVSRGTSVQKVRPTVPTLRPNVDLPNALPEVAGNDLPSGMIANVSDAPATLAAHTPVFAPRVSGESSQLPITLPAMPADAAFVDPTQEPSFGDSIASIASHTGSSVSQAGPAGPIGASSAYVTTSAPASGMDAIALGPAGSGASEPTIGDALIGESGTGTALAMRPGKVSGTGGLPPNANSIDGLNLGRMEEAPSVGVPDGVPEGVAGSATASTPGALQRAEGLFANGGPGGSSSRGSGSVQLAPAESSGTGNGGGFPGIKGIGVGDGSEKDSPIDPLATRLGSSTASAPQIGLSTPQISIGLPSEQLPPENPYVQRAPEQRAPLLKKMGGNENTEQAVADALKWLAAHQSADGRWSSENFDARCHSCGGAASADVDVAVTGLALLCFLGADHTHMKDGPYHENVRKGLSYLRRIQQEDGDLRNDESMYSHGIASICLAEAYGMTKDKLLKRPVERAIDFICKARNRRAGGWRYDPGQAGDTSVMGWQIMALKSAQRNGIEVPDDAFEAGRNWLIKVNSRTKPGLYAYQPGRRATVAMTAEGMFVNSLLGTAPDDSEMKTGAEYLLKTLPDWEQSNTYYWYYATLALFQRQGEDWTKWNDKLVPQLLDNQEKLGRAAGSWPPVGQWAPTAGRVYQTALCALMLEVYYRYLPMYAEPHEAQTP